LKSTPIENFILKIFKMVDGPFALGLIFSPSLALIAKNGELESPNATFSPFGASYLLSGDNINTSEGSYY
jgi:hypothetical protein